MGLGLTEGTEEQDVLGRVGQVILTPDDVADLHRRVVNHDREVVQRGPVRADDDEIATDVGRVDFDPPADHVVERDQALRHAEAQGRAPALCLEGGPLGGRQQGATAVVARRLMSSLLATAHRVELFGGAVAGIRLVGSAKAGRRLFVQRQTLHLPIRTVGPVIGPAGNVGALVPGQAQPVQAVDDVLLEGDRRADGVGVLQPKDEDAALVASEQVVEQGRAGSPDVKRTGGTWRDSDANVGHGADCRVRGVTFRRDWSGGWEYRWLPGKS